MNAHLYTLSLPFDRPGPHSSLNSPPAGYTPAPPWILNTQGKKLPQIYSIGEGFKQSALIMQEYTPLTTIKQTMPGPIIICEWNCENRP